ncbi:LOW QUALITY PROTEIN: nuclear factor interleukin-3-regulated protein-like [Acanthochromis polyacanthus]|uniref:LOW QUALITY PROTEIN: nuclear factor interleukin-3-regulated protein-like n=1 Tax=Acanthochromis polyacanthus TaxID=80966 RepID=UPI0022347E34|nr:LOW QUALITY PROTEIN: nuclear factor interleukin-3-regulated protein-like [Acanthochromis polyacanthus]
MSDQSVGAIIQDQPVLSLLAKRQGATGSFSDEAASILSSTNQLARTLLGHTFPLKRKESPGNAEAMAGSSCDEDSAGSARRKREFIPNEKKDEGYWDKRRKNNEAAKRSREKRRANDMVLERRVLGLLEENARLKAELLAIKLRFGLIKDASDVSILPLSAPLCAQPSATHYYHNDAPSYLNTQPSAHQNHPQSQGAVYKSRASEPLSSHSASEEFSASTSCSSNVGSPVFFDDTLVPQRELVDEQHICPMEVSESQYVNRQEDGLRSLPHKLRFKGPGGSSDGGEMSPVPPTDTTASPSPQWVRTSRSDSSSSPDGKLGQRVRLLGPERRPAVGQYQGSSSGYYNSSFQQNSKDNKCLTEEVSLRSQIGCLSQEVAQLKRIVSQQLLSKIA